MLDARDLAQARADFATTFFGQAVTRLRDVKTKVGGGESVTPADPVVYAGRIIDAKRDRRHMEGEQQVAVNRVQIELPWDADVKSTDRLQVGAAIYSVIGSDTGRAEALCLTVDVSGV